MLIAKHDNRELNWGNASHRGGTSQIVVLKFGELVEITVDEDIAHRPLMQALHDKFYGRQRDKKKDDAVVERVADARKRREAAEAALLAKDYKLGAEIDYTLLFDTIADAIIEHYAKYMGSGGLLALLGSIQKTVDNETKYAFDRGREDAKGELRGWLGAGSGCRFFRNP
jgi:hypothetical protein